MRTADYIFQFLADRGVRDVFMVSGGGAMFLNDALGSEPRLRAVCTHHEQGAAIAAEGYARVTGGPAVVSVTTGPGGTNALTGVIGEWLDSQPVLYLSGQVKFPTTVASVPELPLRQLGDQEINIVDIVRPVTKYAKMVTDPLDIRRELEKALRIACSGRPGPVWLDIPINVQSAEIDPAALHGEENVPESKPEIPAETIERVVETLLSASSPVLVTGQGIRLSGNLAGFEKLVERLKIPVLGSFNSFDLLPTGSPYSIGRIGTIGTRAGNIALQNADWVLCLGTRNNIRQVSYNHENFAKRAKELIVVDIDAAELAKPTVKPTLPVHGDAGEFIDRLLAALAARELPGWSRWLAWNRERKERYPVVLPEYRSAAGLNPYALMEPLCEQLPADAVVSCTNATPSLALFQAGAVKRGQRMFCNSGCAAMGFGLPAALGAAAAVRGKRPVVCLEGDGSLMMNLQELQTIRHNGFPVKLFLFDNNEYCSIRQTQDSFFAGRHTGCDNGSGVTFPEWQAIAAAFGWRYLRLDSLADAAATVAEALAFDGPVFCDCVLAPGYTFAPKLSSRRLPDGSIISPSLEDMFPFLPREEMEANRYEA